MERTNIVDRLGRAALDVLFPPRCAACDAPGAFICPDCLGRLTPASPPRCRRCWRPGVEGTCAPCRMAPPAFDGLLAAYVYEGVARDLVQALKYRGFSALARPMAGLLASAVRERALPLEAVVPVPLSGLRGRTRGYNQAGLLAGSLAAALGLPFRPEALRRRRHTAPQARSAGADERRRNVAGAFQARNVAGARLLLVDDVTTTGATLAACAEALTAAGARSVWAVAFARED